MQEINLTVIGDTLCSTTRTYLTYLKAAELKPQRLWVVSFTPAQRLARLAGQYFGNKVGNFFHSRQDSGEPGNHTAEFQALCMKLQEVATENPIDLFGDFNLHDYATSVEEFAAEDYHDGYLRQRILEERRTAFLYTSGGLVPENLLNEKDVKIFHVHPGVVPEVRGSDCFLWSCLTKSRPGVSCFYLSPGIDEGDLLGVMEFNLPDLSPLLPHLTPEGESLAYRALLFAVDPHMRAQILVSILKENTGSDLRYLPTERQPPAKRPAFLWMHPRLRLPVMKKIVELGNCSSSGKLTPLKN